MKMSFTKYLKSGYKVDDMAQEHPLRRPNARRAMRRDVKRVAERKFNRDQRGSEE